MSNRVGPIPPEKGQPEPSKLPGHDSRVTQQGVEKVREVDPDEQSRNRNRARQFQSALDDAEQRLDYAKSPFCPRTPFDVYKEEQRERPKSKTQFEAPPPPTEEREEPLPQSNKFWKEVDEPPDQPPPSQKLEETPFQASHEKKKGKGEGIVPAKKGEDVFPSGAAGKPEKEKKVGKKKGALSPGEVQEKKPSALPGKKGMKKPGKDEWMVPETPPPSKEEEEKEKLRISEQAQRASHKKEKHPEILPPSTQSLPSNVAPVAQAAATQAAPYLSPEVLPLFYQMVGMIHVMAAPPGVSRTEVVLNSPSFSNSRFFGSTITIEKYASAPNALNIRLSGSNEAVAAFNQNLSKLAAAFDRANLPFQINRLEATYSRPVFRRKEPGEGRGETGGGFEQKKGG